MNELQDIQVALLTCACTPVAGCSLTANRMAECLAKQQNLQHAFEAYRCSYCAPKNRQLLWIMQLLFAAVVTINLHACNQLELYKC